MIWLTYHTVICVHVLLEPRPPEKPQVDVDNYGINILLAATTDQFGPIR